MKIISVGNIDGIGECELREPPISAIRDKMALMADDSQQFMLEVLAVSLYSNGEPVDNALDKIGLSDLSKLTPQITEILGFGDDAGND